MALTPQLTALDERVLALVPRGKGCHARDIVAALAHEHPDTIQQILRGLQATGHVTQSGGWWRRT